VTVRLDDLDVICAVLGCEPSELLIHEPDKVAARRPQAEQTADGDRPGPVVKPRFGYPKSEPPL
jgi:hypothetical protein